MTAQPPACRSISAPRTRRSAAAMGACVALLALAGPACKKAAPPPAPPAPAPPAATPRPLAAARMPDAAPISCPAPDAFIELGGKGRTLHVACTVLYEGFYWGAAVLAVAGKGPPKPVLHFLTGGPHSRTLVYEVEPAPTKDIEALVRSTKQVGVTIRRTRGDRSLVRMGITAQSGSPTRPESREIGVLLQLVAHAPPKILWWGPGDQTSVEPSGCVNEQTVDFELLFRTRLERFITTRSRPAEPAVAGKPAPPCAPASSMQENVGYQATALKSPRPL